MRILLTGSAGFIGMHVTEALLKNKHQILGVDNLSSYYSVKLKKKRLTKLIKYKNFIFKKIDINNFKKLDRIFKNFKPTLVINLAAQAGVRYSSLYPDKYLKSNIVGFFNILQLLIKHNVKKFIFASSSSVYGVKSKSSNSEDQNTDKQLSFYASTKKSNESMAFAYSHLYNLPTIGIRFFTVYGPWGRPDMALFKFTEKIIKNKYIEVYNNGEMYRSFTYIDDVTKAMLKIIAKIDKIKDSKVPYKILNIGSNKSEKLLNFISLIEKNLNKKAKKKYLPIQMGDTNSTKADLRQLKKFINYEPKTKIAEGIGKFIEWHKSYINSNKNS